MRIPNNIFSYGLSANDFRTYCGLLSIVGSKYMAVKNTVIANRCGCSLRTAERSINNLVKKGLIVKTTRTYWDKGSASARKAANSYRIILIQGGYFNLDYMLLQKVGASASAFYCYAFLRKCSNRLGRAFPSLSKISDFTGLCRTTVIKVISELISLSLIIKRNYTKLCGCFGNNNYVIADDVCTEEQKEFESSTKEKIKTDICGQKKTHTMSYPHVRAQTVVSKTVAVKAAKSILKQLTRFCQVGICKLFSFFRK